MNRQQILDLYEWRPGTCFQHPRRGRVLTAAVGVIHRRSGAEYEVRACEDCLIAMEEARREAAKRTGGEYRPGCISVSPSRS